jgi:hypothetical protein
MHTVIKKYITAHRSIAEIPLQRGSLRSFKAQSSLGLNFFFLSAERAERKKQHPFGKFSLLVFICVPIYDLQAGN